MSSMTTAIYARISSDTDLQGLGVTRQIGDCQALAKRRSWASTETYVDNDVSASTSKPRPEYMRLLKDIRAGKVRAVVVWDIDRLTRKPAELETFIALADVHHLDLASVGGEVDISTPQGRMMARVKGAVAAHEVEQQSRRIKRKVEELAAAGLPFGGGLRPFGYDITRLGVVEVEAVLIREAARRVLGGDSLRSVVKDWNARGIVTVTGKPWSVQSLRNVLKAPRMAGLVELRGKVVGAAQWPAILDQATHEALRYLLLDPSRAVTISGRPRRYWWAGMVFCGRCDKRMGASGTSARRQWRCLIDYGGCGRVTIDLHLLEPILRATVLRHASYVAIGAAGGSDHAERAPILDAAIAGAESRLDGLADAFAQDDDGDGDAAAYRRASKALETRLASLRAERAALVIEEAEARLRPDLAALATDFDALPVEQRAKVAAMVVEKWIVGPGRTGRFNRGRVETVVRFNAPAVVEGA